MAVHEVKISKKERARINKRSGIPPNAAEINKFSNLYTASSYDNYGNPQPFGTEGVASAEGGTAMGEKYKHNKNDGRLVLEEYNPAAETTEAIISNAKYIIDMAQSIRRNSFSADAIGHCVPEIEYALGVITTELGKLSY